MLTTPFYHETIRRITLAFGSLFNNLSITRVNKSGTREQTIKVPIAYGPTDSWYARLKNKSSIDEVPNIQQLLPRMSFELAGIQYDGIRQLDKHREVYGTNADGITKSFSRVPYTGQYKLYVGAKSTEDGLQIVEQIFPYFRPNFFVTIKEKPEAGYPKTDVDFKLINTTFEDNYEEGFEKLRSVMWTLTFEARFFFNAPTTSDNVLIREIDVDMFGDNQFQEHIETIKTYASGISGTSGYEAKTIISGFD